MLHQMNHRGRRFALGSMNKILIKGITVDEIVSWLDSLYAYEMMVVHYSLAVLNRLEGQASIVLEETFEEKIKQSFEHARTIADRIGQLGGAITGDPSRLVEIAPIQSFSLPKSNADVREILSHNLQQLQVGIRAYGGVLSQLKDKDEVTYHLLLAVVKAHIESEDEIEVALVD
jgi:ferritin-like protein